MARAGARREDADGRHDDADVGEQHQPLVRLSVRAQEQRRGDEAGEERHVAQRDHQKLVGIDSSRRFASRRLLQCRQRADDDHQRGQHATSDSETPVHRQLALRDSVVCAMNSSTHAENSAAWT